MSENDARIELRLPDELRLRIFVQAKRRHLTASAWLRAAALDALAREEAT